LDTVFRRLELLKLKSLGFLLRLTVGVNLLRSVSKEPNRMKRSLRQWVKFRL
jgi:hypothetical protein